MDNTLSKQLLLSILGLAILIVAIVGVSYAVLVEPNSNLNSKDIVYIDYDTDVDGISLIGSLPMKDSEGIGMSSYLDFKVISNVSSNNNINYEVLLERVKDDDYTLLGDNEVRIYLEKLVNGRYVPVDNYPSYLTSTLENNIFNAGNSSIEPYMEFARTYPVRDSMRMMRLLYRLSLGRQERKQEQLLTFSRSISSLQQKARETKYKERLDKMEGKTMSMLISTGLGVMILLVLAVMQMMNT